MSVKAKSVAFTLALSLSVSPVFAQTDEVELTVISRLCHAGKVYQPDILVSIFEVDKAQHLIRLWREYERNGIASSSAEIQRLMDSYNRLEQAVERLTPALARSPQQLDSQYKFRLPIDKKLVVFGRTMAEGEASAFAAAEFLPKAGLQNQVVLNYGPDSASGKCQ